MPVEAFLDTNVLLYAYDRDAGPERETARQLVESALRRPERFASSVQVLQEFSVNFLRKGGAAPALHELIADFSRWFIVENSIDLLRHGLILRERWQLSFWDSMVVAAALASGAGQLLTENLSHGQDYGGVKASNPFRAAC